MKRVEDVPYVARVAERERGSEIAGGKVGKQGRGMKKGKQRK